MVYGNVLRLSRIGIIIAITKGLNYTFFLSNYVGYSMVTKCLASFSLGSEGLIFEKKVRMSLIFMLNDISSNNMVE